MSNDEIDYLDVIKQMVKPKLSDLLYFECEKFSDSSVPFDYVPNDQELENIDGAFFSTYVNGYPQQNTFPKCMMENPNILIDMVALRELGMPIDWLGKVKIPSTIKSLHLFENIELNSKVEWPKDLVLSQLEFLSIPNMLKPFVINLSDFKKLGGIELNLSKERSNNKIKELSDIDTLEYAAFSHIKNLDVFTPLSNTSIQALCITASRSKNLPIKNIVTLKTLKTIWINDIYSELDCSLFLSLPDLKEINIFSVKNISNVDALLLHPTLRNITFVDCNKPFSKMEICDFHEKKYDVFDIEYS